MPLIGAKPCAGGRQHKDQGIHKERHPAGIEILLRCIGEQEWLKGVVLILSFHFQVLGFGSNPLSGSRIIGYGLTDLARRFDMSQPGVGY